MEEVTSFPQSLCLCFGNVVDRRKVNSNIKQLNKRLDLIGNEEDEFKFIPNLTCDSNHFKRIVSETTSKVNANEIHGRDSDKEILVSKLLCESSSEMKNGIPIISVVGAGGMGKTTLAQLVFNDRRIEDNFEVKIWVCVSDPFDGIKIAKAILEALNKNNAPSFSQFETFLEHIENDVSAKKFLLVLDDVWTEDDTMWKPLRISLNKGAPGSKILVTTRKTRVAQVMGSSQNQVQSLDPITSSDCWTILSELAFRERTEQERELLEDIGLKIVSKCKGLPLAATTIGSLLRFKSSVEQWRGVLESQMWELEKVREDIFPFLVLSYDELNPIAKRCFSYCAIFPKDTSLKVETLIRIWCAQGFLSSIATADDMELKGREMFDDLAARSFFQEFEQDDRGNKIRYCKMHDIVHDFAQFLTKNECLILKNVNGGATLARHLNLLPNNLPYVNPISHYSEKCRSFFISESVVPPNLLSYLKRVRVLILDRCYLEAIPREIGSSVHLRYLDLTGNSMKELPETICDLYNLETLILSYCIHLRGLPQGIRKLRKLRHLPNDMTRGLEFPEGSEELTNLQTLSCIDASSRGNWKNLRMLRNMNRLDGSLTIYVACLDEDEDKDDELVEAAKKANLTNKNLLKRLRLCYTGKVSIQVIEALQPHPNLQILAFAGPCLPEWLTTLTALRELYISGESGNFSTLPPLGKLCFLEHLWVCGMPGMKLLNREFLGIDDHDTQPGVECFPRLKTLHFTRCGMWEEWEDISEEEENDVNLSMFPSLQHLKFSGCLALKELPHRLLRKASSLEHLEIYYCDNLRASSEEWKRDHQSATTGVMII